MDIPMVSTEVSQSVVGGAKSVPEDDGVVEGVLAEGCTAAGPMRSASSLRSVTQVPTGRAKTTT
jgi:hypothetical protein